MVLYINFLPKHNIIELMHQPENGKTLLRTLVSRLMPSRLAEKLLSTPELAICGDIKIAQLSKKSRQDIFNALHKYPFIPNRREGLHRAEAASGGLDTTELNSNFMSTKQPNLYFVGEMLDITGLLGGYNLHFAFASAYAVIKSVSKKKSG